MDLAGAFTLRVEQVEDFELRVRFDKDNDSKLAFGTGIDPNPVPILAAALADCLTASLVYCLRRRGVDATSLRADVRVQLVRNERKQLRVGRLDVTLHPSSQLSEAALAVCLETFEAFCVVAQSVRDGIDVNVKVARAKGGSSPPLG